MPCPLPKSESKHNFILHLLLANQAHIHFHSSSVVRCPQLVACRPSNFSSNKCESLKFMGTIGKNGHSTWQWQDNAVHCVPPQSVVCYLTEDIITLLSTGIVPSGNRTSSCIMASRRNCLAREDVPLASTNENEGLDFSVGSNRVCQQPADGCSHPVHNPGGSRRVHSDRIHRRISRPKFACSVIAQMKALIFSDEGVCHGKDRPGNW